MRYCLTAFLVLVGVLSIIHPSFAQSGKTKQLLQKESRTFTKLENRQEKLATKEAALKERLAEFKDKKKATKILRVSANLSHINKQRIANFTLLLGQMDSIIKRLQTYVSSASASGKDVSTAQQAITAAETALTNAKTAVEIQSLKDYTITVTDEEKVIEEAKEARDKLKSDLETTHESIKQARTAVVEAIKTTLRTIKNIPETKAATESGGINGQ
ncbi:MAG: hypothetical protein HYT10_03025 [Candidatus Levybacteria bacterium]|nr:hypothetical protein [Candidatus Levybacteria bacterium]